MNFCVDESGFELYGLAFPKLLNKGLLASLIRWKKIRVVLQLIEEELEEQPALGGEVPTTI